MIYPSDIPNLNVTKQVNRDKLKNPVMYCNIDKVPTYRTMIDFKHNVFYEVPLWVFGTGVYKKLAQNMIEVN